MIDSLYARYSRRKDTPPDPNYKPEDSIRSRSLSNEHAAKLAVIFPGWHTHKFPINFLIKRLVKRGWAVLAYDFHDQILEPDDEVVLESFRYIRQAISEEITDLIDKNNYQQVHLIGISLGNVAMTVVAGTFSRFTGATIVVGGDDLAVDMWHGERTIDLRDSFRKAHISLRKLDKDWRAVSPVHHIRHFAQKKVYIFMSLNDRFILTKYQIVLADNIKKIGADVSLKHSRFGHTVTIIRYCMMSRPV